MRDLAPEIYRQRLVIEGYPAERIVSPQIIMYLSKLAVVLDMNQLTPPITHRSPKFGEAGWVHWETSGTHFYAWDEPQLFFSADIYTCKPFDALVAVEFTKEHFQATDIEFKEF